MSQELLDALADEVLTAVETQTKQQLKGAAAELDVLCVIQEELTAAEIGESDKIVKRRARDWQCNGKRTSQARN